MNYFTSVFAVSVINHEDGLITNYKHSFYEKSSLVQMKTKYDRRVPFLPHSAFHSTSPRHFSLTIFISFCSNHKRGVSIYWTWSSMKFSEAHGINSCVVVLFTCLLKYENRNSKKAFLLSFLRLSSREQEKMHGPCERSHQLKAHVPENFF